MVKVMTHLLKQARDFASRLNNHPYWLDVLTNVIERIEEQDFLMRTFEQAVPVLAASVMDLQAKNADLTAKLTAAEANAKSPADAAAEAAVVTLTESLSPST